VIIDKGMLVRFVATVIVVGAVGYFAMYTLWPPQPVSRLETPPDTTVPVGGIPTQTEDDYFAEHRIERDRERSARLELLKNMMNNPNLDATARAKAQMEIINASTRREQEKQIERLIMAQGFADAVVVFGEGNAVAVVRAASLTEGEALAIAETICNISGLHLRNVRVRFRK
jgi:stage III sporulation protein AH